MFHNNFRHLHGPSHYKVRTPVVLPAYCMEYRLPWSCITHCSRKYGKRCPVFRVVILKQRFIAKHPTEAGTSSPFVARPGDEPLVRQLSQVQTSGYIHVHGVSGFLSEIPRPFSIPFPEISFLYPQDQDGTAGNPHAWASGTGQSYPLQAPVLSSYTYFTPGCSALSVLYTSIASFSLS